MLLHVFMIAHIHTQQTWHSLSPWPCFTWFLSTIVDSLHFSAQLCVCVCFLLLLLCLLLNKDEGKHLYFIHKCLFVLHLTCIVTFLIDCPFILLEKKSKCFQICQIVSDSGFIWCTLTVCCCKNDIDELHISAGW